MKTKVHYFPFRIWYDSYAYIYQICTQPGAPSINKFLNQIIQEWTENDKKKKETKKS